MYNPKLHFHFTGIGGTGMSGLAEILLTLGFRVSGTDVKTSPTIDRLRARGARVEIGHAAEHVAPDCSSLVYSSAVSQSNPEIVEAKRLGIPVVQRAAVLAELMRLKYGVGVAGSHGKTTTTSMTAWILERAGLDPTVIIGGLVKSLGTGGKLGKGQFLVAETDESDRSFLLLRPTIAVVTNIDAEHLSAYSSMADLVKSFETFVHSVPFYGLAVLCVDDPIVRELAAKCECRKVTYGFSDDALIRVSGMRHLALAMEYTVHRGEEEIFTVRLPLPGKHMVLNSLAAIAVALEFGIPPEKIKDALESFAGVERRLEVVGEANGIKVMNDYGHHPTEIRSTLAALRAGAVNENGALHVVFQPHRYTRTRDCFTEFLGAFQDCDNLLVTSIYSAGEPPVDGIDGQALARAINHPKSTYVGELDEALTTVVAALRPGDTVLCLGAGSVGGLPCRILTALNGDQGR